MAGICPIRDSTPPDSGACNTCKEDSKSYPNEQVHREFLSTGMANGIYVNIKLFFESLYLSWQIHTQLQSLFSSFTRVSILSYAHISLHTTYTVYGSSK